MKVKDLLKLLETIPPEAIVRIRDRGSILPTAEFEENSDYNSHSHCPNEDVTEFFILVAEDWEDEV